MATYTIRLVLIFSVSLLWFFANTGETSACSCAPLGSPTEQLADSTSVFAGKVIDRKESENSRGWSAFIVEFEVTTVWKGPLYETIYVGTNDNEISCGFEFHIGIEYIVYTYNGWTGICRRTDFLARAKEDLVELGKGYKPLPGTSGPQPGASRFPPEEPRKIDLVDPSIGWCSLGSSTADAVWLGIMAGLVWFGVRRRPRR